MTHKPLIIITLDAESPGGYSKMPWYALRENYCTAIEMAGGIPLPVPHHSNLAENYADLADGFVFTGGNFDIDPNLYGHEFCHNKVTLKPQRTLFEWRLLQEAYTRQKPILGICGGMQLLNVVLGGTLIQHIPDEVSNCLAHEQPNARTEPGHEIHIEENTLLYRLVRKNHLAVNSAHHQAVKTLAKGLSVNAVAPDGVIEGIEDLTHPFCLGLQWHPEYHVSDAVPYIFTGLIQAAAQ
jgi:putative glutamine amidotransferase